MRSGKIRSAIIIRVDILPVVTSSVENFLLERRKMAPCCGRNSTNRRSPSLRGLIENAGVASPFFVLVFAHKKGLTPNPHFDPATSQLQLIQIGVFNYVVRVGPAEVIVEPNSHERCPNKSHA